MFTEQQSQMEQALIRGGVPADSAKEITDSFMNCALAISHRGPLTLDYTPKNFRFIGPEGRKYQFPGVDAPVANPDFRPPLLPTSEGLPEPDPYPEEPQDARPPFGPAVPPDDVPQFPNPSNPNSMGALRPVRVVTNVGWNLRRKRMEVEYSIIWCWFGGIERSVELKGRTVEVMTDLRVEDNNKLYGDTRRIGVLSVGDLIEGAITIEGVECDYEPPPLSPEDPGYEPGGL